MAGAYDDEVGRRHPRIGMGGHIASSLTVCCQVVLEIGDRHIDLFAAIEIAHSRSTPGQLVITDQDCGGGMDTIRTLEAALQSALVDQLHGQTGVTQFAR